MKKIPFYQHIIDQYKLKTGVQRFSLLNYLLVDKSPIVTNSVISHISFSTDINFKSTHKNSINNIRHQRKVLTFLVKNILEKNSLKKDMHFYHKEITTNKIESNVLYKQLFSIFFIKQNFLKINNKIDSLSNINFLRNSLKSKALLPKEMKVNFLFPSFTKSPTDKNKINSYNIKTSKTNLLTFSKKLTIQEESIQDNRITASTMIYNIDLSRTSTKEQLNTTTERSFIEDNSKNNQSIKIQNIQNIEKNIQHINQLDIKNLADKVYPIIVKKWQKEFEKRGVFYG